MPFVDLDNHKILFVHIPRTGGTTIEHWMRTWGPLRCFSYGLLPFMRITPQHLTRNDLAAMFGEDYFTHIFSLVRNPFKRIESEYRLQAATAKAGFYRGFMDFAPWLESNLSLFKANSYHSDNHFRRQFEFLGRDVQVFKFEDGVGNAIRRTAETLDIPCPNIDPEDRHYNTDNIGSTIIWDAVSIERVLEAYRHDFEQFNYDEILPL